MGHILNEHIPASVTRVTTLPNEACHYGGLHPRMAGEDDAVPIDQYRVGEAERPDAVGDLFNLACRMDPGIHRVSTQSHDGGLT